MFCNDQYFELDVETAKLVRDKLTYFIENFDKGE